MCVRETAEGREGGNERGGSPVCMTVCACMCVVFNGLIPFRAGQRCSCPSGTEGDKALRASRDNFTEAQKKTYIYIYIYIQTTGDFNPTVVCIYHSELSQCMRVCLRERWKIIWLLRCAVCWRIAGSTLSVKFTWSLFCKDLGLGQYLKCDPPELDLSWQCRKYLVGLHYPNIVWSHSYKSSK